MSARRKSNRSIRNNLWFKEVGIHPVCPCHWCDAILEFNETTLDHVLPKAVGGTRIFDNVVIACKKCNRKRGREVNRQIRKATKSLLPLGIEPKDLLVKSALMEGPKA